MESETDVTHDQVKLKLGGSPSEATREVDPLIGSTFATQYKILECIGSGLKGRVYKAVHVYLDRPVALKILSAHAACDRASLSRFQQEARLMNRMNHPNIVGVQQFGVDVEGIPYLVTDFEAAISLGQLISKFGQLDSELVIQLGVQAAAGVAYAHRKGLLHRDLKPGNMLVRQESDGSWNLKLIDFGLAKSMEDDQSLTGTGLVLGTPQYMSPEQCEGRILDGRTDVYSLGCTLYEALMGQPPFDGVSDIELAYKHAHEPVPPLRPDVYPSLKRIVLKALAKKPDDRYATMEEMHENLVHAFSNPADDWKRNARVQFGRAVLLLASAKGRGVVLMLLSIYVGILIMSAVIYTSSSQTNGVGADMYSVQSSNQGWYQNTLWAETDEAGGDLKNAAAEYEVALLYAKHSEVRHQNERIKACLEALKRLYTQLGNVSRVAEIDKELSEMSLMLKAR